MKVDVMTRARMEVRRELSVPIERCGRFIEDAFALAVADDVVGLAGDGLDRRLVHDERQSKNQGWRES